MRILTLLLLLSPLWSFSQDRSNDELPKIVDNIAKIKTATGWVKNDVGKWISKQNSIPDSHTSTASGSSNSSDIDNFVEYTLLKISYKGKNYFCLLHKSLPKHARDGMYNSYRFSVFDYFDDAKVAFTDTLVTMEFTIICNDDLVSSVEKPLSKTKLLEKIYQAINAGQLHYDELMLSSNFNKSKNYIRFFIDESYTKEIPIDNPPKEVKDDGNWVNYFETNFNNAGYTNFLKDFIKPLTKWCCHNVTN